MANVNKKVVPNLAKLANSPVEVCELVKIDCDGVPIVKFVGSDDMFVANFVEGIDFSRAVVGQRVLVLLPYGESAVPVIAGIVNERVSNAKKLDGALIVDGETLKIKGARRITLECGKSSITLTSEGKIIVKGRSITSRASDRNKIRGATVSIN